MSIPRTAVTGSDDDKSRLERLIEIGVYAPVGFLVTRSQTVPDLAKAGRRQIAFARSLGQAALKGFVRSVRRDDSGPRDDPPASIRAKPQPEAPVASDLDAPAVAAAAAPTTGGEVEGYDELTAKEIVELIKSADRSTLAWIDEYESAHRGRVTVARAVTKALG